MSDFYDVRLEGGPFDGQTRLATPSVHRLFAPLASAPCVVALYDRVKSSVYVYAGTFHVRGQGPGGMRRVAALAKQQWARVADDDALALLTPEGLAAFRRRLSQEGRE